MATGVGRGGICVTLFNIHTPKTPCYVQESRWYLPHKPSYCLFCPKFRCYQQGSVVVEFVWHHSIAQPSKPPVMRKNLGDIFYTSWVIVDFVTIATGVGRSGIFLTSFNSPTTKTPCYVQESLWYLPHKLSYCLFCLKFCCHGNRGRPWWNFSDIIQSPDHENPLLRARISVISLIQAEL